MVSPSDRPSAGRDSLRGRAVVALVGRDHERASLEAWVGEGTRLIAVTGPAGVGKTRLVEEAGESLARSIGSQTILARLEHATDLAGLDDAVLSAASRAGTQANGRSVIEVLSALGPTLLVLDPIDPLLAEGKGALSAVGSWLDACPELSVVLVGRGRSHLAGERVLELLVLDEASALTLFTQLAALHRPGFSLKADGDREAALSIVRSLDHLPLAIELATPRLAVMTPPALLHRLKNRWEVLKKSAAGGHRHDTLEAAILWSLELLEPGPRALLEGATVFRGGFSIEVAEAVLLDEKAPSGSIVDGLLHLKERSLLSVEEPLPGEVRLSLLESVRLVAERGLDGPRKQRLEDAHAMSYVHAAETWAREVEFFGSAEARARLSLEHDNLAVVVERILGRGSVSTRAADRALRVLCALGSVLRREGASALLRAHLETAIQVAQGSGADPRLLARALCLRGALRAGEGRLKEGERDLAEALVLASHSGERAIEARVLVASAAVAAGEGQAAPARALLNRAKELAEAGDDRTLLVRARLAESLLDLEEGALSRARLTLEETLAHARRTDDLALRAEAQRALGMVALYDDENEHARAHLVEAVELSEVLRDLLGSAEGHLLLGVCLARAGQGAEGHLEQALSLSRREGRDTTVARSAVVLALHFMSRGERGEARALLREVRSQLPRLHPDLSAAALISLHAIEETTGEVDPLLLTEARKRTPSDPVLAVILGLPPSAGPTLHLGKLFGMETFARPRADAVSAPAPSSSVRPPRAQESRRSLTLDADATFFALDGQAPVDLSRRRPLRRLLAHLARTHGSGDAVGWDALLGVGWPGEKMRADAGAHRVRVAISTLRKMGLSGILETDEEGYRLKKGLAVTIEP